MMTMTLVLFFDRIFLLDALQMQPILLASPPLTFYNFTELSFDILFFSCTHVSIEHVFCKSNSFGRYLYKAIVLEGGIFNHKNAYYCKSHPHNKDTCITWDKL